MGRNKMNKNAWWNKAHRDWTFKDEAELKTQIDRVNARLRALEKSGLSELSPEYRLIQRYAIEKPKTGGKIYNVNTNKGTIRVSKDLKKFSGEELSYLRKVVGNILKAETSTISGTKAARTRAYEKFKEERETFAHALEQKFNGFSEEDYGKFWKVYRDMVRDNELSKDGSSIMMNLIEMSDNDVFNLSEDEIRKVANIYYQQGIEAVKHEQKYKSWSFGELKHVT